MASTELSAHKLVPAIPAWTETAVNDAGQVVNIDSECDVVNDVSLDTKHLKETACQSITLSVNDTVQPNTISKNELQQVEKVPYHDGLKGRLWNSWYITPDYEADLVGRQLDVSQGLVTRPLDWRIIAREDQQYTITRPQHPTADTRLKLLGFESSISYISFVMGAVLSLYGVLTPCITIYNAMLSTMADTHIDVNTLPTFQQFSVYYTIVYPFASLLAVWVCAVK